MNPFKVGDFVKCIHVDDKTIGMPFMFDYTGQLTKGKMYEVTEIVSDGNIVVKGDNDMLLLTHGLRFELPNLNPSLPEWF